MKLTTHLTALSLGPIDPALSALSKSSTHYLNFPDFCVHAGKFRTTNDQLIAIFLRDPHCRENGNGTIHSPYSSFANLIEAYRLLSPVKRTGNHSFRDKGADLAVHRIVYATVVGPLVSDLVINYKDRNRSINHSGNLELVTVRGKHFSCFQVLKHLAILESRKISPEIAGATCVDRAAGLGYREPMASYGQCELTTSFIIDDRIWKTG